MIFGSKPKYTQRYNPPSLANAPANLALAPEAVPVWTSPFADAPAWGTSTNNKNRNRNRNAKQFSTIVVQTNKPITTAQHNRLLNKIKQVTAV